MTEKKGVECPAGAVLTSREQLIKLLSFTIPGIHSEQYGSANQPWDQKVARVISKACQAMDSSSYRYCQWYAVNVRWFVTTQPYRRDLDNLRVKPILDSLTRENFWMDDKVEWVRAIYSEVVIVDYETEEKVEVTVYGALR